MPHVGWITATLFALDLLIRIGLSVRVVMRRLPVGVSLGWLAVILIFPFVGSAVYLLLGELRLGNHRARRSAALHRQYARLRGDLIEHATVDWSSHGANCEPLARLNESAAGIPALAGNDLELLGNAEAVFDRLIADIEAARRACHLEFYIWSVGGRADEVAEALLRAAGRGVACRVLVDAVGSHDFLRSELIERLRSGGVDVQAALSTGLVQMLFTRFDLRLHRKIVVIDDEVAYTGSMNLVDPKFFKQGAHVGQWIDAMVRMQGPAVAGLAVTFLEDWELETGQSPGGSPFLADNEVFQQRGTSAVQVVPSGPAIRTEAIEEILLMTIYSARRELVLTTPYFVPDESLLTALISAAQRGVDVTLVIPAKINFRMVRLASQAHQGDLLAAGIRIAQFEGGLLHTKSVTVDGEFSLFGSLNLDPRSLHLNFEITLAVFDSTFTGALRALQQQYIEQSQPADIERWRNRSAIERFTENAARLIGPLL